MMLAKLLTPARIKRIREDAGYTRDSVAELMNVSPGTVNNWEKVNEETGKPVSVMDVNQFELWVSLMSSPESRKESRKIFKKLSDLLPNF